MVSHNILYLFILIRFLNFAITEAQDDPFYLYQDCSSEKTNPNTSFQFAVITILSSLSSNTSRDTQFYNTTVTGTDPSDSIYGLFMCRADVPSQLCKQCVVIATQKLSSECPLSKQAVIWYEECIVRYSTSYIFSIMATTPNFHMQNSGNVSNPESFKRLLFSTVNETADEAANASIGEKKFATKEVTVSKFETLYCLAQCTPDLSPQDCRTCLREVIGVFPSCCEGRLGGRVQNPSCNIRYEFYPFYNFVVPSPMPAPFLFRATTNTSHSDSKFSKDPIYLSHNCSTNKTFTSNTNSTFQLHLKTLLSYFASNATSGNKFHKEDVNHMVYGLFMCRGDDLPSTLCGQCIENATRKISTECGWSQEAIIWYSQCMLRYSFRNFFSIVETSPIYSELNITTSPNQEGKFFIVTLAKTLDKSAIQAGDSAEKYGIKSSKLNDKQTLYTLGQCTQDLSINDCKGCLGLVIGTAIPWSHLGSIGGRVMYPSCNLRFELFPFYRDNDEAQPPSLPRSPSQAGPTDKQDSQSRTIILIVVVSTIVVAMLFSFGYYWLRRKARKSYETIIKENFGQECAALKPWQFDLTLIEAATKNFDDENRIGKGGFGEVYKGILLDGQQIAVKRLSTSSKQGANEFKNEILLIAKLQHRNLVAFIGFCLEEREKILIYEYVPNKSLDYFLFDSRRQMLSWFQRYNIIGGIARGIHYLHEHSRLKVIHRDLKPSNILLDENMIPKISDFGLARIVEINQDQGSTNRIVGTFGYMSPEYAMFGQFSEKSDVFSFGVMVLEIITGKKNLSTYESHRVADGLLSYVWKQWMDQTPLSTLEPKIKENYSEIEVIKCIQIGLLCVQQNPDARPSMTTIISYLNSHFIELPTPEEPAFFLHGRMDAKIVAQESNLSQSINTSTPFSINEMPISECIPR